MKSFVVSIFLLINFCITAGGFFADLPQEDPATRLAQALIQNRRDDVNAIACEFKQSPSRHNTFAQALALIGSRCPDSLSSALELTCERNAEALERIPVFFWRVRTKAATPVCLRELLSSKEKTCSFLREFLAARLSTRIFNRFGNELHEPGRLSLDDVRFCKLLPKLSSDRLSFEDVWQSFLGAAAQVPYDSRVARAFLFKEYLNSLEGQLSPQFLADHHENIMSCLQEPNFCILGVEAPLFESLINHVDLQALADSVVRTSFDNYSQELILGPTTKSVNFRAACLKTFTTKTTEGSYPLVAFVNKYIEDFFLHNPNPEIAVYVHFEYLKNLLTSILDAAIVAHPQICYAQCMSMLSIAESHREYSMGRKCSEFLRAYLEKLVNTVLIQPTDTVETTKAFLNSLDDDHLLASLKLVNSLPLFIKVFQAAFSLERFNVTQPVFAQSLLDALSESFDRLINPLLISQLNVLESQFALQQQLVELIDLVHGSHQIALPSCRLFLTNFVLKSLCVANQTLVLIQAAGEDHLSHQAVSLLNRCISIIEDERFTKPRMIITLHPICRRLAVLINRLGQYQNEYLLEPLMRMFALNVGFYTTYQADQLQLSQANLQHYLAAEQDLPSLIAQYIRSIPLLPGNSVDIEAYERLLKNMILKLPATESSINRFNALLNNVKRIDPALRLPGLEYVLKPCFSRPLLSSQGSSPFSLKREELAVFIENSMRPTAVIMAHELLEFFLLRDSVTEETKLQIISQLKPEFATAVLNLSHGGSLLVSHFKTPQHIALLPHLITAGLDINARGTHQQTALMQSVLRRNYATAEALMHHGARLDLVDDNDRTIIDIVLLPLMPSDTRKLLLRTFLTKEPMLANRLSTDERLTPLMRFAKCHIERLQSSEDVQSMVGPLQEFMCDIIQECMLHGCSLAPESLYHVNLADIAHLGGLPQVCEFVAERLYASSPDEQDPYISHSEALAIFNERCSTLENVDLMRSLQHKFAQLFTYDHTKIRRSVVLQAIADILSSGDASVPVRDGNRIIDADGNGSLVTFDSYRQMVVTQTLHRMFNRTIELGQMQEVDSLAHYLCALKARRLHAGASSSDQQLTFDDYPVRDPLTLDGFIISLHELRTLLSMTQRCPIHALISNAFQNEGSLRDACLATGIVEDEVQSLCELYRQGMVNLATVRHVVESADSLPSKRPCVRLDSSSS